MHGDTFRAHARKFNHGLVLRTVRTCTEHNDMHRARARTAKALNVFGAVRIIVTVPNLQLPTVRPNRFANVQCGLL